MATKSNLWFGDDLKAAVCFEEIYLCVLFILLWSGPCGTWHPDGKRKWSTGFKKKVGATERRIGERWGRVKREPGCWCWPMDEDRGGGGGRPSVWELGVKKQTNRGTRRTLVGDHPETAGLCGGSGKVLRRRSSSSGILFLRVGFLFFLSGGSQQMNRGRRRARRVWKKGQLRMLLLCENGSDRQEERWACTGASAPFRLPSLRKLFAFYLFIYLFICDPLPHTHPPFPRFPDARPGRGKPKCGPDIGKPILLADAVAIKDCYPDCLHGQCRVESERDPAWRLERTVETSLGCISRDEKEG